MATKYTLEIWESLGWMWIKLNPNLVNLVGFAKPDVASLLGGYYSNALIQVVHVFCSLFWFVF